MRTGEWEGRSSFMPQIRNLQGSLVPTSLKHKTAASQRATPARWTPSKSQSCLSTMAKQSAAARLMSVQLRRGLQDQLHHFTNAVILVKWKDVTYLKPLDHAVLQQLFQTKNPRHQCQTPSAFWVKIFFYSSRLLIRKKDKDPSFFISIEQNNRLFIFLPFLW